MTPGGHPRDGGGRVRLGPIDTSSRRDVLAMEVAYRSDSSVSEQSSADGVFSARHGNLVRI